MTTARIIQEIDNRLKELTIGMAQLKTAENILVHANYWATVMPGNYKKAVNETTAFLSTAVQQLANAKKHLLSHDAGTEFSGLKQVMQDSLSIQEKLNLSWTNNYGDQDMDKGLPYSKIAEHYQLMVAALNLLKDVDTLSTSSAAAPPETLLLPTQTKSQAAAPASKEDEYWFLKAQVGDAFKGEHIGTIHILRDEYIIYSTQEDPSALQYYFAGTKPGEWLDQLGVTLDKLNIRLQEIPEGAQYLPAVSRVYSLAMQGKVDNAKSEIADIIALIDEQAKKKGEEPAKPPPTAPTTTPSPDPAKKYGWILALSAFVIAGLLFAYFKIGGSDKGIADLLKWGILLFIAIAAGSLVVGLTGSDGKIDGEWKGIKYSFAGPVVFIIVGVAGYFYLQQNKGETIASAFASSFTVRVFNGNHPIKTGEVKLFVNKADLARHAISDGQAIFADIDTQKLAQPLTITVTSPGFLEKSIDTLLRDTSTIRIELLAKDKLALRGNITQSNDAPVRGGNIGIGGSTDSTVIDSKGNYYLKIASLLSEEPVLVYIHSPGFIEKKVLVELKGDVTERDFTLETAPLPVKPVVKPKVKLKKPVKKN